MKLYGGLNKINYSTSGGLPENFKSFNFELPNLSKVFKRFHTTVEKLKIWQKSLVFRNQSLKLQRSRSTAHLIHHGEQAGKDGELLPP